MTGQEADIFPPDFQGADWWSMNPDGSGQRRLTFMNKKDHPQSLNKFRLAGVISFINDSTFLGDIQTKSLGLEGFTSKVIF